MSSDLAIAYHNLSNMLGAGVPVQRSLNTVTPGLKPRLKKAFTDLKDGVAQGNCLHYHVEFMKTVIPFPDYLEIEIQLGRRSYGDGVFSCDYRKHRSVLVVGVSVHLFPLIIRVRAVHCQSIVSC